MYNNTIMEIAGLGGLIAFTIGWFCAQSGKLVGDILQAGKPLSFKEAFDRFVRSGGMPSGHTASFLALTTYFGVHEGIYSNIFVLALCTSMIVIYDAVNVRYAVGEQGKLLNVIVMDHNYKKKKVKVVEGHTIPQVIVGGVLGIAIGLVCAHVF